ncbi:MAG: hypothetical protein ACOC80_15070 [Petrotogales bacterium]
MNIFFVVNRFFLILSMFFWGASIIWVNGFVKPLLKRKTSSEMQGFIFRTMRFQRRIVYLCWLLFLGTSTTAYSINDPLLENFELFNTMGIITVIVFFIHIFFSFYLYRISKMNEHSPMTITEREVRILINGGYINIFLFLGTFTLAFSQL